MANNDIIAGPSTSGLMQSLRSLYARGTHRRQSVIFFLKGPSTNTPIPLHVVITGLARASDDIEHWKFEGFLYDSKDRLGLSTQGYYSTKTHKGTLEY